MNQPLDIQHLVFNSILGVSSSPAVEQNLSESANLTEDLKLSRSEIIMVGFTVERELQYLGLPSLTDQQIVSWEIVQDIIDTVTEIVGE